MIRRLFSWFRVYTKADKKLFSAVKNIIRARPISLPLYHLSMQHSSSGKTMINGFKESNERLEYLGDAILGAVVADYLFKKYPYKNEGFLTEIRSRIVSRVSLNDLAIKIGLGEMIQFDGTRRQSSSFKSMHGDAMEAFVGAVYLDRGYKFCKGFIINELIHTYLDIDNIIAVNTNYKSQLIEWAQQTNKKIDFHIDSERGDNHNKQFKIELLLDEESIAFGTGYSKKKAEQDAARRACLVLKIDDC
jgi:ribonuclease-3